MCVTYATLNLQKNNMRFHGLMSWDHVGLPVVYKWVYIEFISGFNNGFMWVPYGHGDILANQLHYRNWDILDILDNLDILDVLNILKILGGRGGRDPLGRVRSIFRAQAAWLKYD